MKIQQVVVANSITIIQEYMKGGLDLNRLQQTMPTQTDPSNSKKIR